MKWEIKKKLKGKEIKTSEIIESLLYNRGVKTKKEISDFLKPDLKKIDPKELGISDKELKASKQRVERAIKDQEQIIVYGDYDVDGICGTAVLWEVLNEMGANVLPYIPHRAEEGYGLSIKGIENIKSKIKNPKLIITVDNGIVASSAVDFANKEGIDVIITDHHTPAKELPKAYSIIHTTKVCGAAVAWLFSKELQDKKSNHLELVAIASIADMVPLKRETRALVKEGLRMLKRTKRIGLLEIFEESALNPNLIGTYQIGHIVAPRLNAMGRLEYAIYSLRLLCTKDKVSAKKLAQKLGLTNRKRQGITEEMFAHAGEIVRREKLRNFLFVGDKSYQEGVVGLVAGKLVEEFYRPTIVYNLGDIYCKASARSIPGFNIIDFIRSASDLLVDAGGHPMAAGFTFEKSKLDLLKQRFEELADSSLKEESFQRVMMVDLEIPFELIDLDLARQLKELEPFGVGNPTPVFTSKEVLIEDIRSLKDGKHLKFKFKQGKGQIEGIIFNVSETIKKLKIGDKVNIAYSIEENEWNGNIKVSLKIKDIMP